MDAEELKVLATEHKYKFCTSDTNADESVKRLVSVCLVSQQHKISIRILIRILRRCFARTDLFSKNDY